jgi:hypothetical protein
MKVGPPPALKGDHFARGVVIAIVIAALAFVLLSQSLLIEDPSQSRPWFVVNAVITLWLGYGFLLTYKRRDTPLLRALAWVCDNAFNLPGHVSPFFLFGLCLVTGLTLLAAGFNLSFPWLQIPLGLVDADPTEVVRWMLGSAFLLGGLGLPLAKVDTDDLKEQIHTNPGAALYRFTWFRYVMSAGLLTMAWVVFTAEF